MNQDIREKKIKERKALLESDVHEKSRIIVDKIRNNPYYQKAKVVAIYYPINNEVDLLPLLEDKKTFLFPKVIGNKMSFHIVKDIKELRKGYFGILEPINEEYLGDIDLILTPLLAFDDSFNRLGYGKGFYDRFFKNFKGYKLGVAYQFQKQAGIEVHQFDIKLDDILSEV